MKKRQKKARFGFRAYFWAIIIAELAVAVLVSTAFIVGLEVLFHVANDSLTLGLAVLLCAALGAALTSCLNRWLVKPIRQLGSAMRDVARGDFKIQLSTESSIREMVEINDNFNLMVRALDATEVLQSDFVSNVSHEFKTPITAIEGYAMLLQGTPEMTEEQQEYVDKILLNTRRLSGLIGNVLLLSKIENQAIRSTPKTYQLDEQIRRVVMLYEHQWTEKELELDVELERIDFTGDEGLMLHVWSNLISNAIKFNSQGGLLRLRLMHQGGRVVFTVEDDGPGISVEDQAHIFDKFYQADNSRRQEGNGLGLALVKRILNVCGGEICVEARPEGGSRFTVMLTQTPV